MAAVAPQSLPTASVDLRSITVQIARQMLSMVGAGWQAPQGSNNAADALAIASSYADLRALLVLLANQIFVSSATGTTGLLSEWEALLGIAVNTTLTDAQRQARLVAFTRSAIEGTPQAIESAVSSITGSATVYEISAEDAAAGGTALSPRSVFHFAVVVPIAYITNAQDLALITAVIDRMKPAHTAYSVVNAIGIEAETADNLVEITAVGI